VDLLDLMQQSGPFLFPMLGVTSVGLMAALALAVLGATGRRVPAVAWWIAPLLIVLLGAIGTWSGLRVVTDVMAVASPEMRDVLGHAGYSTGLTTDLVGAMLAGLLCVLGAAGASVGAVVAKGTQGEMVRAEQRVVVAGSALLGAIFIGRAGWLQGEVDLHGALAHADPDLLTFVVARAMDSQERALVVGMVAMSVLAGVLALAVVAALKNVSVARLGLSGGLASLGLFSYGAVGTLSRAEVDTFGQVWLSHRLAGLDERASALPEVTSGERPPPPADFDLVLLADQGGWKTHVLDAAPRLYTPQLVAPDGRLLLVTQDRTPAVHLSETTWGTSSRRIAVLLGPPLVTDSPILRAHSFGALTLEWEPMDRSVAAVDERSGSIYGAPGALFLVARGRHVAVIYEDRELGSFSQLSSVGPGLGELLSRSGAEPTLVWMVPGSLWTVQDVVSTCLAAQSWARAQTDGSFAPGCGLTRSYISSE